MDPKWRRLLRDDEREALVTPAYDLRKRDAWWAERLVEARAEHAQTLADTICMHGALRGDDAWCRECDPEREARARAIRAALTRALAAQAWGFAVLLEFEMRHARLWGGLDAVEALVDHACDLPPPAELAADILDP